VRPVGFNLSEVILKWFKRYRLPNLQRWIAKSWQDINASGWKTRKLFSGLNSPFRISYL